MPSHGSQTSAESLRIVIGPEIVGITRGCVEEAGAVALQDDRRAVGIV